MKKSIILQCSYGNSPYLRATEIAIAVRKKLDPDLQIVVPHVYGEKQARILREEFGDQEGIILDPTYGAIQKKVFYDGGPYADYLAHWLQSTDAVSAEAGTYLRDTYDIAMEITRAPLLDLHIRPGFYNAWTRTSTVLRRAMEEPMLTIDHEILRAAAEKFRTFEDAYELRCINVPGTFDPEDGDVAIPPILPTPTCNRSDIEPGIYVTVSGIPGVASLQAVADSFGTKIYCSDPEKISGSVREPTDILAHPNIVAHVARAGWGSIHLSLLTGVPIIVPPHDLGDDPEVFFNIRRIKELGIGIVQEDPHSAPSAKRLQEVRSQLGSYRRELEQRFGTLDGAQLAADKIVAYLLQNGARNG